ncbi:MAG: DUF5979 domain-containing protein, partial [Actinomycetaceae bacterium]|nr:DUF5979 domain-containing protein [Actinomycetaceae bacterium]
MAISYGRARIFTPRVLALIAAIPLLALVVSVFTPLRAHAAVRPEITISNVSFTAIDALNNPTPGQLSIGNYGQITFNWDATAVADTLQAGDAFTIDLPVPQLGFKTESSYPMRVDLGAGLEEIGTCVTDNTQDGNSVYTKAIITCTFNQTAQDRVAQGFRNLTGKGEFQLQVARAYAGENINVIANGVTPISVDLPGTGGIRGNGVARYVPTRLVKGASGIGEKSKFLSWNIAFGTQHLAAAYARAGNPVTFDGVTPRTVSFTDTIGPGLKCPEEKDISLARSSSIDFPGADRNFILVLDRATAGSTTTVAGTFEVTATCGVQTDKGIPVTISITGPFAEETNYTLNYPTPVDSASGFAVSGFSYQNEVSIDDTDLAVKSTKSYMSAAGITAIMDPGYGTFQIAKLIEGPGAAQAAMGTPFTFEVAYELPPNKTATDFPGWTPPGTLNPDGRTGTATYEALLGSTTRFPGASPSKPFPAGTKVSLKELTDRTPAPEGLEWEEPTFSGTTGATNSLTIADSRTVGISVTNRMRLLPSTFAISKKVTGVVPADLAANKEYDFSWSCSDGKVGTLKVKGDGVAVPVTAESFEVGTSCEVREETAGTDIAEHTLAAPDPQTVVVARKTANPATAEFTNAYTREAGAFSVKKTASPVADGKAFTFAYRCTLDGQLVPGGEGTLEATAGGDAVKVENIPTRSSCVVTEQAPQDIPGSTLTPPAEQTVQITAAGATAELTFHNEYTRDTGSFTIAKTVDGNGRDQAAGKVFSFDYSCQGPDNTTVNGTTDVAEGATATVAGIATGNCTVTERDPSIARSDVVTKIAVDGAPQTEGTAATFTLAKGDNKQIAVTNTYTRQTGTLEIVKENQGLPANIAAAKDFTFDVTCGTQKGIATAKGDGTPALVKTEDGQANLDIPVGTQCSITERNPDPVAGFTWNGPGTLTQEVTTPNAATQVKARNEYTRHEGSFALSKVVTGTGIDLANGTEFTFAYRCEGVAGDVREGEVKLLAGANEVVTNVPTGRCSVTETSAPVANTTLATAFTVNAGSPIDGATAEFEVTNQNETRVEATNTYTRDLGTLEVVKTAEGVAQPALLANKEFRFNATCGPLKGVATAKADGNPVAFTNEDGSGQLRVPTGTQCEVTEAADSANLPGYSVTAAAPATVDVTSTTVPARAEMKNVYTPQTGTLRISKQVDGSGAGLAGANYSFTYTCQTLAGETQTGTVTATPNAPAEVPNVGVGRCTVEEAASPVAGTDLSTSFTVNGGQPVAGAVVEFDLADQAVAEIVATNTYTRHTGTVSIAKTVNTSDGVDLSGSTFPFTVTCDQGITPFTLQVPGNGTPVESGPLPSGASCTIAEGGAQRDGYTLAATIDTPQVTIPAKGKVEVKAHNEYTRDMGTFTVKKVTTTNDGTTIDGDFPIQYSCTDGQKGTLNAPANGNAVNGPQVPTGSTCTISELPADTARDGYAVNASVDQPTITIAKDAPVNVTVTNAYTRLVGAFTLSKTVDGDGAALAGDTFSFTYACTDGAGRPSKNGKVDVRAGEAPTPVEGIPTGTCVITEETPAPVVGATLTTALNVDGTATPGNTATVAVNDGATVAVAATNTYTLERGSFSIAKNIVGDGVAQHSTRSYTFDYECTSATEGDVRGEIQVLGNGVPVEVGEKFPVGADCVVAERLDSALTAGYDVEVGEDQEVKITADPQTLNFVNTYKQHTATLKVAKTAKGGPADIGTKNVTFDWKCTNGQEGQVQAKADGVTVPVTVGGGDAVRVPLGTECTITENADSAKVDGYDLTPAAPVTHPVVTKNAEITFTFENVYAAKPVDTPPSGGDDDQSGDVRQSGDAGQSNNGQQSGGDNGQSDNNQQSGGDNGQSDNGQQSGGDDDQSGDAGQSDNGQQSGDDDQSGDSGQS